MNRKKKKETGHECCAFGEKYFPHYMTSKTGEFHHTLMRIVDDPDRDRIDLLAPRGHAKSTWISIVYPIWRITQDRDINILIISDTNDQAELFLRAIKNELEHNERLIGDFGAFRPVERGTSTVWRSNDITVVRKIQSKEPTIFCGGVGKRIVGRRADLILVDDPLNEENVESEQQREKTKLWFMKSLTPIVKKTGRIIVVGTKKHADDLHTALRNTGTYACHTFKAIGEKNAPLWPEEWDLASLNRKRMEIGERVFSMEYQNEMPRDVETGVAAGDLAGMMPHAKKGEAKDYDHIVRGLYVPVLFGDNGGFIVKTEPMCGVVMGVRDGGRHILSFEERATASITGMLHMMESIQEYEAERTVIREDIHAALRYYGLLNTDIPVCGHIGFMKGEATSGMPNILHKFEKKQYHIAMGKRAGTAFVDKLKTGGVDIENKVIFALWMCEQGILQAERTAGAMEVIDDPA